MLLGMVHRAILLLVWFAGCVAAAQPAPADASDWAVTGEVTYEARDALTTWTGTAPLTAVLTFDPDAPASLRVAATVRPADFRSGAFLRDLTARRTVFEVDRFPEARAVVGLDPAAPDPGWQGDRLHVDLIVDLTLHDVTRRYLVAAEATRADGAIHATASFEVSLEGHGMRRPSLLGLVTEDAVRLHVVLDARPVLAPRPTTR